MSDYRVYKLKLRQEFLYSCGYCKTREPEIGGAKSFHIDHYKPKSVFPDLECSYVNLIYACRDCNQYKGAYWPTPLQRLSGKSIINPRKENFAKHVNMSECKWEGKTVRGKWNVFKFRLDSEILAMRRQDRIFLESVIAKMDAMLPLYQIKLTEAEKQEDRGGIEEIKRDLDIHKEETNALRRKLIGRMD